jgi:hypothetical protein
MIKPSLPSLPTFPTFQLCLKHRHGVSTGGLEVWGLAGSAIGYVEVSCKAAGTVSQDCSGNRRGGSKDIDSVRVEAGAPRVWYDRMRGVGTIQNQRPEEHNKANESALAVMDWLSQTGT